MKGRRTGGCRIPASPFTDLYVMTLGKTETHLNQQPECLTNA